MKIMSMLPEFGEPNMTPMWMRQVNGANREIHMLIIRETGESENHMINDYQGIAINCSGNK